MSVAGRSPEAFPGWPAVEAYLLECVADGGDAKLTAAEAAAVIGEMARIQHRLVMATRAAQKVQAGDGCWSFEQGYAPCSFRSVDRFLEVTPKWRWWKRLRITAGR